MNQVTNTIKNLLVIDSQVNGWQDLATNISSDTAVLILDSSSDGLTQISDYLTGLSANVGVPGFVPLQSIQILSHGSAGSLLLGSKMFTTKNLNQYSKQLAVIGNALSETGDILLYGCSVAQEVAGEAFIAALAQATGADVAASNNVTGAIAQGGDWLLEANTGIIESKSVLDITNTSRYANVLSSPSELLNAFGSYDARNDTFTVSSSRLFPGMTGLMKEAFVAIFGTNDIVVQGLTVVTSVTDTRLSFHLPNQQALTFIVDNSIIDKMAAGINYLLALDYSIGNVPDLAAIINLSLFNGFSLSSVEFVLSNADVTVSGGNAGKGLTLIAAIDLKTSNNPVFTFIHKFIGIDSIASLININQEGESLAGVVTLNKKIIDVGGFSVKLVDLALSIEKAGFESSVKQSYTLAYNGYDPTQANEPELIATSGVILKLDTMYIVTEVS